MDLQFDILKATRDNYLKDIEGLSVEAFNAIPKGFNNNIIWNVTHVIVTQQLLCYGLTGNRIRIPGDVVANYRKGSRPKDLTSKAQIDQSIAWLTESIEWIKEDYKMGIFQEYKPYTTSYGYTITSIKSAISFNNVHESLHLAWLRAIKKHL